MTNPSPSRHVMLLSAAAGSCAFALGSSREAGTSQCTHKKARGEFKRKNSLGFAEGSEGVAPNIP